nr:integrase, catalytic region, zinc finger, CCHC-type, peptidase aspartic, catalytic [Tanacetum cinerariifolium]
MALGYQNPFYLKQAQKKQQSLYDGKVLLEKHDPPVVHDSEETLQLAQESREKMKQINKEIKPANYTKINHLSREAAKFVGDFKSLAKEADDSLAKHKALEFEIERLLKAVVSQDILFVVLNASVVDTSVLQTELECKKKRFENCIIKKENEYAKKENEYAKLWNDCTIYKNDKLITQLFKKVFELKDNTCDTSANTKFAKQSTEETIPKLDEIHALSKPVTSNSVSTPQESKGVNTDKVIALGMFRINPFKTSREEKHVPNTVRASDRIKPITVSQPSVITKKDVNSDVNGLSSTGVDNTKTRRPQPKSNTKNDKVPSAFKSSRSQNKEAELEEHHRNLLLSKNNKHMSSACINIKLDSQNVISKVVCATYLFMVRRFGCSKHMTGNLKLFINFVWKFMGTVRFGNDHVAVILGFGDLQWGNILITRVYFIEGLGHNFFSVGQFCDSDLEVAFRRNACFVRNLEGVDLLKKDRSTNLYTINLYEMASASPIYLMARASSTKSWLWHQCLSHLNFDTINDLARNDLVSSIPKFKYHKECLCPSSIATACFTQNRSIIHRCFNKTPYELINGRKPNISFLYVFGALCYPKNDREDIGKLGAKGDIGFFIGYSADSCAYRAYNHRKKKIIKTMNVLFDEFSAMAFEQRSSKPGLQNTIPTLINSSSLTTNIPITSQNVDELNPNAMVDENTFVNPFTDSSISDTESSSSQNVDPSNMHIFINHTLTNFNGLRITLWNK